MVRSSGQTDGEDKRNRAFGPNRAGANDHSPKDLSPESELNPKLCNRNSVKRESKNAPHPTGTKQFGRHLLIGAVRLQGEAAQRINFNY